MVNFILIGAVKAGTSSIYHYLKQHPDIFMSPMKETKFFQWDGEDHRFSTELDQKIYQDSVKTFSDYLDQFSGVISEHAVGEATPSYLYNRNVPCRIHSRFPDAKLIVVLRHPVDRAFSHFLHTKRLGYEPLDFQEALAEEQGRIAANWGPSWHYASQGYYYEQVKRFVDLFGRDRMSFYLFDELKLEPASVVRGMYSFLRVDQEYKPNTSKKHNTGGLPKSQFLHQLMNEPNAPKAILKTILPSGLRRSVNRMIGSQNVQKPVIDSQIRYSLSAKYEENIHQLEELIDIDLGDWYQ